jgi:hypothetical protein
MREQAGVILACLSVITSGAHNKLLDPKNIPRHIEESPHEARYSRKRMACGWHGCFIHTGAGAHQHYPGELTCLHHQSGIGLSASQVASLVGYVGPLSLVYKRNVEGTPQEEGSAAAYYGTTFDLSPSDPSKATLVWNGPTQIIVCPACYLVVKDGNQTPAQYVFDIGGWNGQETIELTGFWPAQGAISHVAIFSTGTIAPVPEAETYAMLLAGLGLVGVAVRRKRR